MKTILTLITALLITVNLNAQKPNKNKVKALKIAHLTEQLNLTTKEAQAFWPIYNAHEEARNNLREKHRSVSIDDYNTVTEAEAKVMLETLNKLGETKHKLEEEYFKKLKGLLSAKKIVKLIGAERTFRHKMIDEFKHRHRGERPQR